MTGSSPPRRLAFAVFRLAPAGGLEQHALRLAAILASRGCDVTMVTTRALDTAQPAGVAVEVIASRGRTNHGRLAAFAEDAARVVGGGRFDASVAFHAIPGFDAIFCADPSRAAPPGVRRWLPRYRAYADLQRQALAIGGADPVLMLSTTQLQAFASAHPDARARLKLLPPTVDRRRAASPEAVAKASARATLGLGADALVWLWIGLQPKTKGLDRVLKALSAAPGARLLVCGLDPGSRPGTVMIAAARRLGVEGRVDWLGFTSDAAMSQAMAAADLLIHPSRADVTGTVILEAMANGVPVITTAVCGYGEHVVAADAGVVMPEPFDARALDATLAKATPTTLAAWSANAIGYASNHALYSGLERAADLILAVGSDREAVGSAAPTAAPAVGD